MNSIEVRACNLQEYYKSHITIRTEGNMLTVLATSMHCNQSEHLGFTHSRYYNIRVANRAVYITCSAVSLGIYHG